MCIDKLFTFFKKPITICFEKEQVEGYMLKNLFSYLGKLIILEHVVTND
jgi:hypothetical protein